MGYFNLFPIFHAEIEFGILISPLVVFLFRNLPCFQFGCNLSPAIQHLKHVLIFRDLDLIQTQAQLSIYFTNLQTITVTQFKVQAEQERLTGLGAARAAMEAETETIQEEQKAAQEKAQQAIDRMKELAPAA